MRRVLRYIGPHVSLVVLSLALCLISVALTLYVPILVGRAVDCIVGERGGFRRAEADSADHCRLHRRHGGGTVADERAA